MLRISRFLIVGIIVSESVSMRFCVFAFYIANCAEFVNQFSKNALLSVALLSLRFAVVENTKWTNG